MKMAQDESKVDEKNDKHGKKDQHKKKVAFPIAIPITKSTDDSNIDHVNYLYIGSVDIATQYYPPNHETKDIGLIINLCKKHGKAIWDDSNKDIAIYYEVLSENSQFSVLEKICEKVFPLISNTIYKRNKSVIVHCNEGLCRSPTLTYLYLATIVNVGNAIANKQYFTKCRLMNCIHSRQAKDWIDKHNN